MSDFYGYTLFIVAVLLFAAVFMVAGGKIGQASGVEKVANLCERYNTFYADQIRYECRAMENE